MRKYRAGLATGIHDAIDVERYFERVYESAKQFKGGVLADLFSGGGRDIVDLYKTLKGEGDFAAIDADPQRLLDMWAKNPDLARNEDVFNGKTPFVLVRNRINMAEAFRQNSIAVIEGSFPDRPFGDPVISDIHLRADFMLCNAGIMFVKPEELEDTMKIMADMLNLGGELALRFSLERDDKAKDLGTKYFIHEPELVQKLLEQNGVNVKRHPDLPDPDGRGFMWVDLEAVKPVV